MRESEIQKKMQQVSDIHQSFLNKNYKLSTLDINATVNVIEQLYTHLITSNNVSIGESQTIEAKQKNIEPVIATQSYTKNEEVNLEIEEVFNPPVVKKEDTIVLAKANKDFQLGINEKIMFAKELFDDDVNSLNERINQLKSYENSETALDFFDKKLGPFLIDEGKDEEIIQDFRSIVVRIYS